MTTTPNAKSYIGMGLALLGSNMCLLLLVLNLLDWINIIHADLSPISRFAEESLSPWQMHFATAAVGWVIATWTFCSFSSRALASNGADEKTTALGRPHRLWHQNALLLVGIAATLALPQILEPYRNSHPIIRRSLVNNSVTLGGIKDSVVELPTGEDPPATEELVFAVQKMTCGGCGSHVRNLAESTLRKQQKNPPSFTITNVQVDWRAGVMSIYGTHLTDSLDREAIAAVLEDDGYPTSFLYSQ